MISVVCLAALVVCSPPSSDGWEGFRGPGGQGIVVGARLPGDPTEEDITWRVPFERGHSSPIVCAGGVYLTVEDRDRSIRSVVRVSMDSGETEWSVESKFEPHGQHRYNSFASSTVAVDDSGVYVVWTSGADLIALALDHDGEERWSRRLGSFDAQHGSGSSPLICGDLLVIANDNEGDESFIVGLDAETGEERWSIPRNCQRASYGTPIVMPGDAEAPQLLFASTKPAATAIDSETGDVLWEIDGGLSQRTVATPAVCGDLVFLTLGSGGGGKEALVVRLPDGDRDAEVVYRPDRNLPYVPSALALGGHFYLFSDGGIASCIEASTGDVLWKTRLEGTFYSSPVSDGRSIYIASREGDLFTLKPGDVPEASEGMDVGDTVFATPAIHEGSLFIRTASELLRIGPVAEH